MTAFEIALAAVNLLLLALAAILWWLLTSTIKKVDYSQRDVAAAQTEITNLKERLQHVDGLDIASRLAAIEATVKGIADTLSRMSNR